MKKILKIVLLTTLCLNGLCVQARRPVSDRPRKEAKMRQTDYDKWAQTMRGLLRVAEQDSVAPCMHLDSIRYYGFDKAASAEKESFLVVNNTDRYIEALEMEISYFSTDGRLLHRRPIRQKCFIPPAESRKIDIGSFDTQHSYHYVSSAPGRNGAFHFTVMIRTTAVWVRR